MQKMVESLVDTVINLLVDVPNTIGLRQEVKDRLFVEKPALEIQDGDFAQFVAGDNISGIYINDQHIHSYFQLFTKNITSVNNGFHPKGTELPECLLTHEIGHVIHQFLIKESLDEDLNNIWDRSQAMKTVNPDYVKSELSHYADTYINEFITEGFTD